MRASSICFTLGTILVGALLCPLHVAAQPFVYVDDNNSAAGGNTASGFALVSGGNALASIGSFATTGTGIGMFPPSVQEVAANISGSNCLFVSDPLATTLPHPGGELL